MMHTIEKEKRQQIHPKLVVQTNKCIQNLGVTQSQWNFNTKKKMNCSRKLFVFVLARKKKLCTLAKGKDDARKNEKDNFW